MTRPAADDDSRRARNNRATYELHDRAGEFTSVLFAQQRFRTASDLLLGGSIFPAEELSLGCPGARTGRVSDELGPYEGEALIREALACRRIGSLQATWWSDGRGDITDPFGVDYSQDSSRWITGMHRQIN